MGKRNRKKITFFLKIFTISSAYGFFGFLFSQSSSNQGEGNHSIRQNEFHSLPPNSGHGLNEKSHGFFFFGNIQLFQDEFQLSAEQTAAIEEINKKYSTLLAQKKEALNKLLLELHQELQKNVVDTVKVRKILNLISPVRIDIMIFQIEHRQEINRVLTQDQKDKIRTYQKVNAE